MGDFYRNNRKSFGGRNSGRFARRDSEVSDAGNSDGRPGRRNFEKSNRNPEQRIFHEAICDRCGNRCELPFKPTGIKPVYCSSCHKKNGYIESRNQHKPSSGELEQINIKLDKILKALKVN